jgi:hypothetical protein
MTRTKPIKERQKGMGYKYSRAFKIKVARYYLENDFGLVRVGELFNTSHQNVSTWAKEFSSELAEETIIFPMTEQEQKDMDALKKQLDAFKKKLEYEQMRNFAWETMADLAKTELGIDIRKNFGAKQPKE